MTRTSGGGGPAVTATATAARGHFPAAPRSRSQLSDRELQIARSVARGRTNAEIAAELFISLSTVKSHLTSIHNKLDVRNRVEIAAWAWATGLVQPTAD